MVVIGGGVAVPYERGTPVSGVGRFDGVHRGCVGLMGRIVLY